MSIFSLHLMDRSVGVEQATVVNKKGELFKCIHIVYVNQRYLILKLNLTKCGGKLTLTLHVSLMETINPGFFFEQHVCVPGVEREAESWERNHFELLLYKKICL